jgi:hypothetical protein
MTSAIAWGVLVEGRLILRRGGQRRAALSVTPSDVSRSTGSVGRGRGAARPGARWSRGRCLRGRGRCLAARDRKRLGISRRTIRRMLASGEPLVIAAHVATRRSTRSGRSTVGCSKSLIRPSRRTGEVIPPGHLAASSRSAGSVKTQLPTRQFSPGRKEQRASLSAAPPAPAREWCTPASAPRFRSAASIPDRSC